jgi:uncharacterized protein YmfQ (DUF2313 family)
VAEFVVMHSELFRALHSLLDAVTNLNLRDLEAEAKAESSLQRADASAKEKAKDPDPDSTEVPFNPVPITPSIHHLDFLR